LCGWGPTSNIIVFLSSALQYSCSGAVVLSNLKKGQPFKFTIEIEALADNFNPNRLDLVLTCRTKKGALREDHYRAVSTGGGMFQIFAVNGYAVDINGESNTLIVEEHTNIKKCLELVKSFAGLLASTPTLLESAIYCRTKRLLSKEERNLLAQTLTETILIREAESMQMPMTLLDPMFVSGQEVLNFVLRSQLDQLAEEYEARELGISVSDVRSLFQERLHIMLNSVEEGLSLKKSNMKYLKPVSPRMLNSPITKKVAGDVLPDAVCGALAVLELSTNRGLVCAAPTAGSSGILPGCLYSMQKQGIPEGTLISSLEVMGIIGAIIARRATLAGDYCGCAAETGSASAMAAGGLSFIFGADPTAIFDAAAICLMNTLGLICDPVNGEIEIPCHSRNIAGIGHAFTAAISVLGGFKAILAFDEVVDTMFNVGQKICPDFLCTARGGLAATPTAQKLK
jgi:L-serine dehydratase